jgi:C1A family cysteine protease
MAISQFFGNSPLALVLFGASGAVACQSPAPSTKDAGARPAALASTDLSPAKAPPPLRVTHPTIPALPDLPALSAHEPPATVPSNAGLQNQPCDAVWTGSQTAPIACVHALLYGNNNGAGAVPLVPRKLLSRNPSMLPAVVDHRLEATEGPIRNQADAPACTAFATAAALDHALARWGGQNPAVSVMQIWSRYHAPFVGTSLTSNVGQPMAAEQSWPFNASEATGWAPCNAFARTPKSGCGKPVDDPRARSIASSSVGEFTKVEYLSIPPDILTLQAKLASGQDVMVTMELPPAFVPKGRAGSRYVPNYTKSGGPSSGHAFVLAGYVRFPHGSYFLMHNSWGTSWGDGGYAWLHEATLSQWTREIAALDAEPTDRAPGSRPKRQRGETTCSGTMVPDSITGNCTAPCPDHSPRHDGICPVAGQCPASYVNLTGACVLAAPAGSGRDPSTGIAWTCGPGGCTYDLPQKSDPACTGATCRASCPAPDFHLARMQNSLVCVE